MLDNRKISSFISIKRKQKGLTQQQIAEQLNVSPQAVSKWENGTTYPNTESLVALSGILGITVDDLLNARESDQTGLTYSKAGIDISYIDAIKSEMKEYLDNSNKRVLNGIGPFASLYDIAFSELEYPVLVLKSEEPGSKQKIAFRYGYAESVCHDMVNHLVNDIAVMGAKPLAVLDTIICGHAEKDTIRSIIKGIADACAENECSLVGGETSIQPGVVEKGTYILTSTVAGIVDRSKIIDGSKIGENDVILAVASNGLHTNGYSLIRMMMDEMPQLVEEKICREPFIDAIMRPHTPYYQSIKGLLSSNCIKGMAHITGGGIRGNLSRILPVGFCAEIDLGKIKPLELFRFIKCQGNISDEEMLQTFNCGVGLIIVVSQESRNYVKNHMLKYHDCYEIGTISQGEDKIVFHNQLKWA
jgi:phosphoribosylformylglycinamidine cyclo-ligase